MELLTDAGGSGGGRCEERAAESVRVQAGAEAVSKGEGLEGGGGEVVAR